MFWLLGATDGRAKNFSVWLAPGGRFRLTPLYEIVSTQPSVNAGQLSHTQMKMAMAIGRNGRYVVHTIVCRHFLETAQRCRLPDRMVTAAIEELKTAGTSAFDKARAKLPADFPTSLADSTATAAQRRLASLANNFAKDG